MPSACQGADPSGCPGNDPCLVLVKEITSDNLRPNAYAQRPYTKALTLPTNLEQSST